MGWKLQITALAPQARLRIAEIAAMLARLPGVDVERARHGLHKPPFDLPELKTEADARKLMAAIGKLGLICQIREVVEKPPVGYQAEAVESKIEEPTVTSPTRNTIELSAPRSSNFDGKIELGTPRTTQMDGKAQVGTHGQNSPIKPYQKKSLLLVGLVVFIAIIPLFLVLYSKLSSDNVEPATTSEQVLQGASISKEKSQKSSSLSAAKIKHTQAKKQMQESRKLQEQASKTADAGKAAQLLEKATRLNPYDSRAWKALAARYQRMGEYLKTKTCEEYAQRNEEMRQKLVDISKAYIKSKTDVQMDTATVQYSFRDSSMALNEFTSQGTALKDTIVSMHPSKEFILENQARPEQRIQALPDTLPIRQ